jgi:hypothetical protein
MTVTFPKLETQTEISLDIGSPSFRYVNLEPKVGAVFEVCKAHYVNRAEYT